MSVRTSMSVFLALALFSVSIFTHVSAAPSTNLDAIKKTLSTDERLISKADENPQDTYIIFTDDFEAKSLPSPQAITFSLSNDNIQFNHHRLITDSDSIGTLGNDLFGEQVNLYNGQTSFVHTDISIPGNNNLPVAVSRRFDVESRTSIQSISYDYLFGDWEMELPYIGGEFAKNAGWTVDTNQPLKRCSSPTTAKQARPKTGGTIFNPDEVWHGYQLHVPGQGSQEVLFADQPSVPKPTNGTRHPWVTKAFWYIKCGVDLDSGAADGEGFVAVAPDGTQYTLNHRIIRNAPGISKIIPGATRFVEAYGYRVGVNVEAQKLRSSIRLYATKVQDRFGNHVNYQWDGDKLLSITASDGRSIQFTHDSDGRIISANAHGRVHRYAYQTSALKTVTLPNNKDQWQINFTGANGLTGAWMFHKNEIEECNPYERGTPNCRYRVYGHFQEYCAWMPLVREDTRAITGSITHPSGAKGTFEFQATRHARTNVVDSCFSRSDPSSDRPVAASVSTDIPLYYDIYSIHKKTITGAGLQPTKWQYAYSKPKAQLQRAPLDTTGNQTTTVTHPDGSITTHTHGNAVDATEGQLQQSTVQENGKTLQSTHYTYHAALPTDKVGTSPQPRKSNFMAERVHPLRKRTITQQAMTFSYQIDRWNEFGDPLDIYENSSITGSHRRFKYEYQNDFNQWIIRQNLSKHLVYKGDVYRKKYDLQSLLPIEEYSFGLLKAKNTWNADGTLASVSDALNRTTQYSNYHRGIPQNITHPDGTSITANVDDHGQLTSLTNELGHTTSYAYDQQGRVTQITPPAGFLPTQINYSKLNATEHSLAIKHWKQTRSHGQSKAETYFDALYRPVLSVSTDQDNPSQAIFTRKAFDTSGRQVFESYPYDQVIENQGPYGAVSQKASNNNAGIHTHYDALNRVIKTEQDSELGKLTTTVAYPDRDRWGRFTKQVTNPRGHTTTYAYQAFSQPTYDSPIRITHPDDNYTYISRDTMGKVMTMSQLGLSQYIHYDAHQRPCKVYGHENGATWFKYNAASQVVWQGHNRDYPTRNCKPENAPTTPDVTFTYDNRGRLTHADYATGTDDKTYTYFADGALKTLTSGNSTWAYEYNSLGQPTQQTLTHAGKTWQIKDTYNTAGHHTQRILPSGLTINHQPNAFGQPSRASSFARNVQRHPNQAIKSFFYGNGIRHQTSINTRQLPSNINEHKPVRYLNLGANKKEIVPESILDHSFVWDANANLTELTDAVGLNSSSNQYNTRDFLTASTLPSHNSHFKYVYAKDDYLKDVYVNGIRYNYPKNINNQPYGLSIAGQSTYRYTYDTRGNTLTRHNTTANELYTHTYDVQNRMLSSVYGGNTQTYTYDGHNRRIDTVTNGQHRYSIYDLSGQLVMTHDVAAQKCIEYIHLGKRLIAESQTTDCSSDGAITYQHLNHLGTPVRTSDANGQTNQAEALMPYGLPYSGNHVQGIGFIGHLTDAGVKLVNMQQRLYDPLMRRFLSVDPVTPSMHDGSNLNRYWYANNNPYKYTDPDGRWAHIAIGAVAGGLINGGVEAYVQFKTGTFSAKNLLVETGKGAGVGAATAAAPASAGVAVGGLKVGSRLSKVASVARATGQAGAAGSVGELGAQAAKGQEIDAQKAVVAGVSNATGLTIGKVMHTPAKAMSSGTIPGNPGLPVKSLSGRVFNVGQTPSVQYTDEVLMQSLQDISGEVTSSAVQEVHKKKFEKEIR